MTLKVCLIGCGKIADGHVEEIQKIDGVALGAVCDLELLLAEQLAVRYGIPAHYDDVARMLAAEKPDVVHITTPPQSHLALAVQCIDAGCHVYVEKPLTVDYGQAVELIEHAERSHKKIVVGHSFEFDPAAVALRKLVKQDVLGEIVHIECFLGYNLSGPFGSVLLGDGRHWVHHLPGKLFHNNINHVLYKILEYLPDEKPTVYAHGYTRRDGRFGDVRDELQDEMRVIIAGETTTGYATFSSHARPVRHFAKFFGTKNTVNVDYMLRTVTFDHADHLPSAIGRLLPTFGQSWDYFTSGGKNIIRFARSDFQFFAGMKNLFMRFYDSIRNDSDPPISYRETLRITAIMDQIFKQLEEGRR
ncbi:MAG: Gfo/Idh/MocA family oxidoreductase [Candidatus Latescibacterota bacterium]